MVESRSTRVDTRFLPGPCEVATKSIGVKWVSGQGQTGADLRVDPGERAI